MTEPDKEDQITDGLICAYALDGKGGGRALTWADIEQPTDAGQPNCWLHLDFTDAHVRDWLLRKSGLDHAIVDAMLDDESRPRVVEHDHGLLVILRGVNMNPGSHPEDMVSIRVWIEQQRVITTRRRKLLSIKGMRENIDNGTGPTDPANFLLSLIERLDDRIGPVVDHLDEQIEAAEAQFEAGNVRAYSGEFADLRRQTARIRRYLAPQREALDRLSRQSTDMLTSDQCFELREEVDRITRYLEDLDLVRERSMVAQEEILGQLAHDQNSRVYILSLVAAIFLPLSFVTGLMGMNVGGLPGTEFGLAFWLLVIMMGGAAAGIVGYFKWKKWL